PRVHIPAEANLLMSLDKVNRTFHQPADQIGNFWMKEYVERAANLSEEERWWHTPIQKSIPIRRIKRMQSISLFGLFSIWKYIQDESMSWPSFIKDHPIDALFNPEIGYYYVLNGMHRLDLSCLLGHTKTISAQVYKTKETCPEGYAVGGWLAAAVMKSECSDMSMHNPRGRFEREVWSLQKIVNAFPEFSTCKDTKHNEKMVFLLPSLTGSDFDNGSNDRFWKYFSLFISSIGKKGPPFIKRVVELAQRRAIFNQQQASRCKEIIDQTFASSSLKLFDVPSYVNREIVVKGPYTENGALVQDVEFVVNGRIFKVPEIVRGYPPAKLTHEENSVKLIERALQTVLNEALWRPLFKELSKKARVLDIGTGRGRHFAGLSESRLRQITAFDYMDEFLAAVKKRFPAVEVKRGDWFDTGFGDGSFDAIIGVNALTTARGEGELRAILVELDRIAKAGRDGKKRIFQIFSGGPEALRWYGKGLSQAFSHAAISGDLYGEMRKINEKSLDNLKEAVVTILNELGYEVELFTGQKELIVKEKKYHRQLGRNNSFILIAPNLIQDYDDRLPKKFVRESVVIYGFWARKSVSSSVNDAAFLYPQARKIKDTASSGLNSKRRSTQPATDRINFFRRLDGARLLSRVGQRYTVALEIQVLTEEESCGTERKVKMVPCRSWMAKTEKEKMSGLVTGWWSIYLRHPEKGWSNDFVVSGKVTSWLDLVIDSADFDDVRFLDEPSQNLCGQRLAPQINRRLYELVPPGARRVDRWLTESRTVNGLFKDSNLRAYIHSLSEEERRKIVGYICELDMMIQGGGSDYVRMEHMISYLCNVLGEALSKKLRISQAAINNAYVCNIVWKAGFRYLRLLAEV
ncbi:MAG: class I SAM-dependent methyltransferase, partial [Candidatus Omnitrophota bacterium]